MAKACQVSGTLDSGLTESEVPSESETHFTEEQELEQLINGHLCFKIYPISGSKISTWNFFLTESCICCRY